MKVMTILLLAVFLSGCAGVQVKKLDKPGDYTTGIRYYRSMPYLLVARNNEGNLVSSITYLPDKKEEYVIVPKKGLGVLDLKVSLENGWNLTQFGQITDSKIPEMITALGGLIPKASPGGESKLEIQPGLYEIVFDDNSGKVIGLKEIPVVIIKK
jgi:uncharacterized protein YceK